MYGNARAIVNGQQVGEMAKGSVLGEVALLGLGTMRTASVTAVGTCIALEITRDTLIPLLEDYPEEKEIFERVAEVRSGVNKMLVGDPSAEKKEEKEDSPTRRKSEVGKG